jgi:serine protease Do
LTEDHTQPEVKKTIENRPQKTSFFTKGQSASLYVLTIILSVFSAVIITLILLPILLRVSPIDLYTGKAFKPDNTRTVIKTTGEASPVTAVANKLSPSVVNIKVKKITQGFFQQQETEGVGSGVIFRKDGYILTNNHVIEGASDILVTIGNNTNVKGVVIGSDAESDVAVVKINKTNLPAAEFDRRKPEVGQLAVAIGSPLGFEHTVTSGIVSAVNRAFDMPAENLSKTTYTDLIQTDTAINPGNSGGALANAKGKVIGINTLIASQSGGSEGIGFAIPISTVLDVAQQLMKFGRASHPFIGILGRDVTKEIAQQDGLSVNKGAEIEEITPGSPAAKAKLMPKDVIVKFNDKEISGMEDVITEIRRQQVGKTVTIEVFRGHDKKTFKLTLAEKPKGQ